MGKFYILAVCLCGLALSSYAADVSLDPADWKVSGGKVEVVQLDDGPALKITGRVVMESCKVYPAKAADKLQMKGEFSADRNSGINRFGVRCFTADGHVVPEIRLMVADTHAMKLIRDVKAEDCDLYVDTVRDLRRQYGLVVMLGDRLLENNVLGRFFTLEDGTGHITMYRPVGVTLPAGTPVKVGYVSKADIYFGAVLKGKTKKRSFNCTTMAGMHKNEFHQRQLHPATEQVRLLLSFNENAEPGTAVYLHKLQFELPEK